MDRRPHRREGRGVAGICALGERKLVAALGGVARQSLGRRDRCTPTTRERQAQGNRGRAGTLRDGEGALAAEELDTRTHVDPATHCCPARESQQAVNH
ncbi:hypothetical protein CNECB9_2540029 [Cupriavidus necator]|uniref:Uncharacterized protein n=1 Tax=Cupriavidus necator TaxID=106590 RepID=A0A1K0J9N2_CUPNE|nr:hypothetical protein CNECB9_2540029 [Cupriavidus necator]